MTQKCDGTVIRTWDSARDAEDALGIDPKKIELCLMRKSIGAGGYRWRYADDSEPSVAEPLSVALHASDSKPSVADPLSVAAGAPRVSDIEPALGGLPPGWTEHLDRGTGRSYFHHAATNTTTRDRPDTGGALAQ